MPKRSGSDEQDRFLTRSEAAKWLGLATSTLAVWQSQKPEAAPPMRRHGRRAMYSKKDLAHWSDQRKVG
ncbi:MAG: MerR family transcriptional regulator [Betaproteobacteria bacterium]|nr:MerR family transcriptional regulator [Verrucomicrobiota bacterium]NBT36032.1 MerR family transcriptional regulator [Betaproteobacteria bacterium]NCA17352.1 MerR family transcriptional regulator [Betaproteobacteria bacterium]